MYRSDSTRVTEIWRPANAAVPQRIFRWVSRRFGEAWYTCPCGDWLSGSRRNWCSLHAVSCFRNSFSFSKENLERSNA